jgi:hypothetical protein
MFPPFPLAGRAAATLRTQGAQGTLIILEDPAAVWWLTLRSAPGWARDIREVRVLGPVSRVVSYLSDGHAFRMVMPA